MEIIDIYGLIYIKQIVGIVAIVIIVAFFDICHNSRKRDSPPMMSYKQYQVACGGVREQIKMAQKLHCPHMERKYKQALLRLQTRFLKPDKAGMEVYNIDKNMNTTTYYHL